MKLTFLNGITEELLGLRHSAVILQINTILGYLTADAKGLHPHWNGMLGADDSPAENSYLGLCVSAIINLPTFLTWAREGGSAQRCQKYNDSLSLIL